MIPGNDPLPNAGQLREALVKKCKKLKETNANICCWADLFEHVKKDIQQLAWHINRSPAYVMACTIDDLEADLD